MAAKPSPSRAKNFFFVTGSDEAEVKQAALGLASKLSPSDDPFSTEVIDGVAGTVDEALTTIDTAIGALLTMPMFGGDRLVWLKNANFLADTIVGRSEAVASAMEKLAGILSGGLPDGTRFLLSAPEADKRRALYKMLSKLGSCEIRDKPDFGFNATEADVAEWIERRAKDVGLRLDPDASLILAARVGADTRQIDCEIQKLIAAADGEAVSTRLVRDLVPVTRQGGVFDLSNAIIARNLRDALDIVDQLLRQKESGVGLLLAAIAPTFRNLLLVKDLLVRHRLSPPSKPFFFGKTIERLHPSQTAHLPRKKDGAINAYPLGLAAAGADRFSFDELKHALFLSRNLNRELITSGLSERFLLGKFLLCTLAPQDGNR